MFSRAWFAGRFFGNDDAATRSGAAPRATRQLRRSATRLAGRARLVCEALESRTLLAGVVPGYQVTENWGSGFQGAITLDNQTATATSWRVEPAGNVIVPVAAV